MTKVIVIFDNTVFLLHQIAVSREYIPYHTEKYGYSKPNITFVQGYIEKLTEAGLQENFYDIIV